LQKARPIVDRPANTSCGGNASTYTSPRIFLVNKSATDKNTYLQQSSFNQMMRLTRPQTSGIIRKQYPPRMAGCAQQQKIGTFWTCRHLTPMSSLSGAQFEAEFAGSGTEAGAALLQAARGGDRAAYGQIVVIYQDRLFNALLRMVGETEEARELTQETFTRGLEKIDGFRGDSSPYTWLFRIGMNLAISNLRRSQRRRTFSLDGAALDNASSGGNGSASGDGQASGLLNRLASARQDQPPQIAERRERQRIVVEALGRLDPDYRAVLVMRDIEGFDYQQMADVLGLPLGTLKSRLFRARLAMRDELAPYLEDKTKSP